MGPFDRLKSDLDEVDGFRQSLGNVRKWLRELRNDFEGPVTATWSPIPREATSISTCFVPSD
jgi:hypothetical protein